MIVQKYEIQGGAAVGFTLRCPHKQNATKSVPLTPKQKRNGSMPQTKQVPLFVGSRGCMDCVYNLNRWYVPNGEAAAYVCCSFPVHSWEVPQRELDYIRRGGMG